MSDSFFSLTGQLNLLTRHASARYRSDAKVKEASAGQRALSAVSTVCFRVWLLKGRRRGANLLTAVKALALLMKARLGVFLVFPLWRLAQKRLSDRPGRGQTSVFAGPSNAGRFFG